MPSQRRSPFTSGSSGFGGGGAPLESVPDFDDGGAGGGLFEPSCLLGAGVGFREAPDFGALPAVSADAPPARLPPDPPPEALVPDPPLPPEPAEPEPLPPPPLPCVPPPDWGRRAGGGGSGRISGGVRAMVCSRLPVSVCGLVACEGVGFVAHAAVIRAVSATNTRTEVACWVMRQMP
jgi:hypothetical protein